MERFNLHTHTCFCDGAAAPEIYVKKAIELEFKTFGFSGHAPLPFENNFAISKSKIHFYAKEIRDLKEKYKDQIEIYLGLECDFIPGITDDFSVFSSQIDAEYLIGSIHLVKNIENEGLWFIDGSKQQNYDDGLMKIFDNNIRKAVSAFYQQTNQMIETQEFDIVGHLDKVKMHNQDRFFTEDEAWYMKLVDETLDLIKAKSLVVEVNTRGIYKKRCDSLFPGVELLKKIEKLKIPITLSSDAHSPDEINSYMSETLEILRSIGFRELMSLKKGEWSEVAI